MIEDIKEQPEIVGKLAKKHLPPDKPVQEISLTISDNEINTLAKIYIVASGSSRNAGNIAKYFIEDIAKIPVIVDYASEFAHRNPVLTKDDLFIAISQSGETADTLSALKLAQNRGIHTFALTNNPESSIYNLAQSKMNTDAGKETGIPATKSFTAQLISLYILALFLAEKRKTISKERIQKLKQELGSIKKKLAKFLENMDEITKIANKIKDFKNIVLIGRNYNFAVAQEGSLKIKETSYIDANGYPSGEFLHGYIAVIDKHIPVISIIPPEIPINDTYKLAISNTEEIRKKRNPDLIIIKSAEDNKIQSNSLFSDTDFINIPQSSPEIFPIFAVASLQLLAFKIAEALGRDTNNPRSLTKSITKE